jgi:hypothetical protein
MDTGHTVPLSFFLSFFFELIWFLYLAMNQTLFVGSKSFVFYMDNQGRVISEDQLAMTNRS